MAEPQRLNRETVVKTIEALHDGAPNCEARGAIWEVLVAVREIPVVAKEAVQETTLAWRESDFAGNWTTRIGNEVWEVVDHGDSAGIYCGSVGVGGALTVEGAKRRVEAIANVLDGAPVGQALTRAELDALRETLMRAEGTKSIIEHQGFEHGMIKLADALLTKHGAPQVRWCPHGSFGPSSSSIDGEWVTADIVFRPYTSEQCPLCGFPLSQPTQEDE